MKYCPNCGEKVVENAIEHDKQKEVSYHHYSCPKGHNWKLMLDWYGGVSVIYEKDNLGRTT